MRLIARGYAYKEVAKELFLSVKTVETHVSARAPQAAALEPVRAHPLGRRPPPPLTPALLPLIMQSPLIMRSPLILNHMRAGLAGAMPTLKINVDCMINGDCMINA